MKTTFVFPGQGSQYVGMGQDLVSTYPSARAIFDQADAVLGVSLSSLCFSGPDAVLTDTLNAQPALLTHSIASLRIMQSFKPDVTPAFVAGHSLGEYSALVAAEVIDFCDALRLVRERGRVMKMAGEQMPGAMGAIMGMDDSALEAVCRETGTEIANYNSPGQIVISGPKEAIERAYALARARGARRVLPLAVSIASHSKLMELAAREFEPAVAETPMRTPKITVLSNVNALPLERTDEIKRELVAQLTSSVQWVKSIEYAIAHGTTNFIELGPKDVLAGLIRRINKGTHAISVGDVASVKAFVESKSMGG